MRRLLLNNGFENVTSAREESVACIETHDELLGKLDASIRTYRHMMDLIPETLGKLFSGHIFPYNESYIELETSIHLAMNCFYKSAMMSLRNCLELGLLYLYYDRNDDSERIIKSWLSSAESTPFKRKIVEGLVKIPLIRELNASVSILDRVDRLYGKLCNYLHTAGYKYSANFLNNSNVTRFKEQSLHEFIDALSACVSLLATLFLCKYPVGLHYTPVDDKFGLNGPVGTFLNPYQVAQIREVIEPEVLAVLEPLCLADANATEMANWVNEHPDITEDELREQADKMDKDQIRQWGYVTWYKNIGSTDSTSIPELKEFFAEKHARLEQWARENGCYEHGSNPTSDQGAQAP